MDEETLREIEKFKLNLENLRKYSNLTIDELTLEAQEAIDKSLNICIEAFIYIARFLIFKNNLGNPKDYKEVFEILNKKNIINEELASSLEEIA